MHVPSDAPARDIAAYFAHRYDDCLVDQTESVSERLSRVAPPTSRRRPQTIALLTLGCKVNQAESDAFAQGFAAAGLRPVDVAQPADAYVINSCTVTHVADRKSRQLIRQAKRANPNALVVATGCYTAAVELDGSLPIDLVVPNQEKARLVELVLRALGTSGCVGRAVDYRPRRTRAFVKIQDGCDSLCAFCVIPYVRGRERSVPGEPVVASAQHCGAAGHQEVLLTGVHLGSYGRDLDPPATLRGLLNQVLLRTSVARLRLSSIEPWNFDPTMLDLWSSGRLCRHFHLALQSGCDDTLRRMRRPYDLAGYRRLIDLIRQRVPDVAITTDVIVGFPGETDAEFEASRRAVADLGFAAVHVFPYSARRRTPASKMAEQVPQSVKRERVAAMIEAGRRGARAFRRGFIGRTLDVLYERHIAAAQGGTGERWEGLTDNYLRVVARADSDLTNRLLPTYLSSDADDDTLSGRITI